MPKIAEIGRFLRFLMKRRQIQKILPTFMKEQLIIFHWKKKLWKNKFFWRFYEFLKKKLENKSRFSAVSMGFWVSEFNYLAIFFQIIKEFKAFPFLPLGLKAQRGIAIMVAGGRRSSVGRSLGVQIFRCSRFSSRGLFRSTQKFVPGLIWPLWTS